MRKEILRMDNVITEHYYKTNLKNFNMHIMEREIVGIIGINGNGKELLLDIIFENTSIKYGRVYFKEELINSYFKNKKGINDVYILDKTSKLVNELSIAENIFVVRQRFNKFIINIKVLQNETEKIFKEYDIKINVTQKCKELTTYERCVVELIKGIIQRKKLMVINDLSSFLNPSEWESFKALLMKIKKDHIGILYVGIHDKDLFSFCDRVLLIKDGTCIKIFDKKNSLEDCINSYNYLLEKKENEIINQNSNDSLLFLSIYNSKDKIKINLKSGDCYVIYEPDNLIGQNFGHAILGEKTIVAGKLIIGEEEIALHKFIKRLGNEIVFIEENAITTMLCYNMSYIDNLSLWLENKLEKSTLINIRKSIQREFREQLGDELFSLNLKNLNKKSLYSLLYNKIYLLKPKVVFIRSPFQNEDLYLRKHIYKLIHKLKERGIAIVIFTVFLSDTLNVANEVYYIEEQRIKKIYHYDQFSEIEIW